MPQQGKVWKQYWRLSSVFFVKGAEGGHKQCLGAPRQSAVRQKVFHKGEVSDRPHTEDLSQWLPPAPCMPTNSLHNLLQASGQRNTYYHHKCHFNEAVMLNDAMAKTRMKLPCKSCTLKDFIFFRVLLDSQQNWEKGTEMSHMPPPPHMHSLPIINILPPEWYICCDWRIYTDTL